MEDRNTVEYEKQKLNTKSSTGAEVVGMSDFLSNMIWARMFLEHQGYEIDENIITRQSKRDEDRNLRG